MAGLNKFDPRVESLVVEAKTEWDGGVLEELSSEERDWVATALHADASLASKIMYERAHTGFTRVLTVTVDDIQRLYQQRATA